MYLTHNIGNASAFPIISQIADKGNGEETTERKCANFKDQGISCSKVKRKRKFGKWTQRNGRSNVQLCTENQCNQATLMAFYTNFATEFFPTVFTRRSVLKGTLRRDQKVIFIKSPISSPILVMPYLSVWWHSKVDLHWPVIRPREKSRLLKKSLLVESFKLSWWLLSRLKATFEAYIGLFRQLNIN